MGNHKLPLLAKFRFYSRISLPEKQNPEEIPGKSSRRPSNRLIYLAVILFFSGSFLIAIFGFRTFISIPGFLRLLGCCILASLLMSRYFFHSIFPMKRMENINFAVFGSGPALCGLYLVLNFTFPLHWEKSVYVLDDVRHDGSNAYFRTGELPCDEFPELCSIREGELLLEAGDSIRVNTSVGLGGFRALRRCEILK